MTALRLRLREPTASTIDVSHLVPERLRELSPEGVAQLQVWKGAERLPLGELFDISGAPGETLEFETDAACLWGIGYGMSEGTIRVHGPAGPYAGRKMRGGELHITGNAGEYAGNGMRGGRIVIDGDAGDCLAAARPGEKYGMEGGLLLVRGNAGDRVGERMRRGSVLIEGNSGAWTAARMRAGTIAVLGSTGHGLGWAMRRGTILLRQPPASLSPLFRDNGEQALSILALMSKAWRGLDGPFVALNPCRVQRWLGDRSVQGLGEILLLQD
ncbi:formylmethanofuran dehydrogenase subunit C [Methylonatrum kenyense]|uniref:formylmethanofuran dehydrogenase subunit C n=1 Tax=Methylonatrum kenyense TaxID=455253 RepID=UPI0020BDCB09|nr:formylmethanofuran dehydrogenase subunit C [Methylonatrum kenyense]MCK8515422.1 formylmethanofuran dehydrogenase subunit C [Methylonatrum kenyense]